MGHLISPLAFRLHITQHWKSAWFNAYSSRFSFLFHCDLQIISFLYFFYSQRVFCSANIILNFCHLKWFRQQLILDVSLYDGWIESIYDKLFRFNYTVKKIFIEKFLTNFLLINLKNDYIDINVPKKKQSLALKQNIMQNDFFMYASHNLKNFAKTKKFTFFLPKDDLKTKTSSYKFKKFPNVILQKKGIIPLAKYLKERLLFLKYKKVLNIKKKFNIKRSKRQRSKFNKKIALQRLNIKLPNKFNVSKVIKKFIKNSTKKSIKKLIEKFKKSKKSKKSNINVVQNVSKKSIENVVKNPIKNALKKNDIKPIIKNPIKNKKAFQKHNIKTIVKNPIKNPIKNALKKNDIKPIIKNPVKNVLSKYIGFFSFLLNLKNKNNKNLLQILNKKERSFIKAYFAKKFLINSLFLQMKEFKFPIIGGQEIKTPINGNSYNPIMFDYLLKILNGKYFYKKKYSTKNKNIKKFYVHLINFFNIKSKTKSIYKITNPFIKNLINIYSFFNKDSLKLNINFFLFCFNYINFFILKFEEKTFSKPFSWLYDFFFNLHTESIVSELKNRQERSLSKLKKRGMKVFSQVKHINIYLDFYKIQSKNLEKTSKFFLTTNYFNELPRILPFTDKYLGDTGKIIFKRCLKMHKIFYYFYNSLKKFTEFYINFYKTMWGLNENYPIIIRLFSFHNPTSEFSIHYIKLKLSQRFFVKTVLYPLVHVISRDYPIFTGFRLECYGRFQRRGRAKKFILSKGSVPLSKVSAFVDYTQSYIGLKHGIAGIRIWLSSKNKNIFNSLFFL